MTARGQIHGHPIEYTDGAWRFCDTGEPTAETYRTRDCGYCSLEMRTDQPDPCLGMLPGVMNACCGHGQRDESYIQFDNGMRVHGFLVSGGPDDAQG